MLRLRVKEVAEAKGYNMSSLARKTGLGFTTIKRLWKNPEEGAHIDTLYKVAKALDVKVDDLLEEIPDE